MLVDPVLIGTTHSPVGDDIMFFPIMAFCLTFMLGLNLSQFLRLQAHIIPSDPFEAAANNQSIHRAAGNQSIHGAANNQSLDDKPAACVERLIR